FSGATLEAAIASSEAQAAFFSGGGEAELSLSAAAEAFDAASAGQARRALARATGEIGEVISVAAPHGLAAPMLYLVGLGREPMAAAGARKIGAALGKTLSGAKLAAASVRCEGLGADAAQTTAFAAEMAFAARLLAYRFDARKSATEGTPLERLDIAGVDPAAAEAAFAPFAGLAAGVTMARDLTNEPANFLYPRSFADRVEGLTKDGLEVEILGEPQLEEHGMGALLGVGRGSRKESLIAVMRWSGAPQADAAPIAFIGKGVCFDTGGISLKPAAGMEEMTMDMAGAAVVTGVMKALALRKAPVNAVGVLGLVENMPDGDAQRPGDVVTAMSGKTIEIINTDAEGRLVLADALWYAQERFKPTKMINLATLTGAVIIALGHEKAGLFSNDDDLAAELLAAAEEEGEGLWRLPLGPGYDKSLKSRIADMKNTGGRAAGSVTAAQFLQRFVKDGQAWAHLDIAGVASTKEDGPLWPKGASGWGVATLVRLAESAADEG
ncbi:MAG: leucyl aminopeptidase, partial [Pseudomonadota bacterium]